VRALARNFCHDPALPTMPGQFSVSKLVIDEMIFLSLGVLLEQNGVAQKGMARKIQAETKKQQAETTSVFTSSRRLRAKLHAELFDVTHTSPGC